MEGLRIWLVTIGGAIVYGVAHDQITARVAIEYFTIGHQRIFVTESPTLIAIGWGVLATWWVGGLLGLLFVLTARFGGRPKLALHDLIVPGAALLISVAGAAFVAGIAGYVSARVGLVSLAGVLASEVPSGSHARFIADAWAHLAAYVAGFVGGLGFVAWIWLRRAKLTAHPTRGSPEPSQQRAS